MPYTFVFYAVQLEISQDEMLHRISQDSRISPRIEPTGSANASRNHRISENRSHKQPSVSSTVTLFRRDQEASGLARAEVTGAAKDSRSQRISQERSHRSSQGLREPKD